MKAAFMGKSPDSINRVYAARQHAALADGMTIEDMLK